MLKMVFEGAIQASNCDFLIHSGSCVGDFFK